MSKRFFTLFADQNDERWSYTATSVNATLAPTLIAAPKNAKEIRHLDFFNITILNKNTNDFTMTAHVRDASASGTILAQWPLILDGSTNTVVNPAEIHLVATKGSGLFFTTDTVQPSVTATVNAAGWTDTGESY